MTTPILAFGMPAAPEWIFIGILALVLFGPKKLPELARGLGKALAELQKAKEDFHREITGVPPLPKIQSPEGRQQALEDRQQAPEGLQGVTPPARLEAAPVSTPVVAETTPAPTVLEEKKEG